MVASLVFTLLLFSPVAYGFVCRVNSCILCSSAPVNCTVTPIDQYSYNYYCEAPPNCTPQNVPTDQPNGYYCVATLFIRNLSSIDFVGDRFNFIHFDSCEEVASHHILRDDCLNITERVSSLERTNIFCACKGDNCQDIINVTIIIDPPNDVSSSALINGVTTSSSSPSSVHSSVSLSPSLSSSTIADNEMSSSHIRATTASSSTLTLIPPFTTTSLSTPRLTPSSTPTITPSSTPTTNTISAMTTALVIIGVLGFILLITIALFVVGLFCLYRKRTSKTRQEIPALHPPLSFEIK